jgi:uncharacterized membrane protein
MAAAVVIGLVILGFFLAGGVVGAVALIALAHWTARRRASRPWRWQINAKRRRHDR